MRPRLEDLCFLYQPVAPVVLGASPWCEALVRWQHPDGTVRGPLEVLPYWLCQARIEEFTQFTLLRGAQVLAANAEARLSVNLSPKQVMLPSTILVLEGMLRSITARLHVELTEECHADTGALARQMVLLRERCGVVVLDDVAPGDLRERLRLDAKIDGVKIDRSVIDAALHQTGEARESARRFVGSLCDRYPIVVAEGVEEPSASVDLQALGVSHVQGFGIARPAAELRTVDGASVADLGVDPAGAGAPAGACAASSVRNGSAAGLDSRTRPVR